MRHSKTWIPWLATFLLLAASIAQAQIEAFEFRAGRVPVGQVLHYLKTERDGTHPARISVFVPAIDRVEVLKWNPGDDRATLVIATMDWNRFSASSFEAWELTRGGAPELRATLGVHGDELRTSFTAKPLELRHWPWHSYDFDFTSLNLTLAHLRNRDGGVTFWRTDYVHGDSPTVAELGEVRLEYQGPDTRDGVPAWRYAIGGPGLDDQQGQWWIDRDSGLTLEYELPIGDEPGYDSVRLKLQSADTSSPGQWQELKRTAVRGS